MTENERSLHALLEETRAELLVKERKFELLTRNNIDMLMLISADEEFLYASPALSRVLGFSNEEILNMRPVDLVHPDDVRAGAGSLGEIPVLPGQSVLRQQRILHKDGTSVWCEGTTTNMLHEPGINALILNLKDITEQRSALAALEQSENRYRELFEVAPEGIVIIDTERFVFTEFNANALKFLKLTPEKLLKMGPMELCPKFQPDGLVSEVKVKYLVGRALAGEKPVFEWLVKNGEGKLVFFEVRLVALSASAPTKIYASFVDITARKTMEVKLISQNRILLDVAAFQSHQVRKPVASLLGLISLLDLNDPADPSNIEILQKIKSVSVMFDETIKAIISKTGEIDAEPGALPAAKDHK